MPIKEYLQEKHPEEMAEARAQFEAMQAAIEKDPAQIYGMAAAIAQDAGSPAADIVSKNLEADAERAFADQWEAVTAAAAEATGKPAEDLTAGEALEAMHNAQEAQEISKEEPGSIEVDTGEYNAQLDPNAPEFNMEAYKKAIADAGGMEAMTAQLKTSFEAVQKQMQETVLQAIKETAPAPAPAETGKQTVDALKETAAAIATTMQYALMGIKEFINSDTYKAVKECVSVIASLAEQNRAKIAYFANLPQALQEIAPFLEDELEEMATNPEYSYLSAYTLDDILEQGFDADGNQIESPFTTIIERAKQRLEEFNTLADTITTVEQTANEIPRIMSNKTDLLAYPLDKPNSNIWSLLAGANNGGQLSLNINTGAKGNKQDAIVYYNINFDELDPGLKITKALTPFDKRVYIAAAALYNGNNEIISATQIYKMMGNSGQPKTEQVQRINDSLTKMGAARVYIDNTSEVKVNKKYPIFKYDAPLLPFERISAYINNTWTPCAIRLFREPPLITFARERGQITGLTRQLLESPISKTDANLQLEDYLLERIGHMKNPKSRAPRKMLFATIYDHCKITTRNQRSRAPEKIAKYLGHWKKCGWIAGYNMEKDGVTILL